MAMKPDDQPRRDVQDVEKMSDTSFLNEELIFADLNEVPPVDDFQPDIYHCIDEEATNIETKCTPGSKTTQQRQENFSIEEDKLLVSSWLNTSQDPVTGSDQKAGQFWKRIVEYFNKTKTWSNEQTEKSLISRWTRISKEVSRFSGCFVAIDRLWKSGYTEPEKIAEAKHKFKDDYKTSFMLDHCWVILRFHSKWMDESKRLDAKRKNKTPSKSTKSVNLEDGDVEVQDLTSEERPMGRKAVKEVIKKAKIKEQNSGNEHTSKSLQLLEELRAKRLENEQKRNDQFELLFAAEQKQIALKEKELEIQARNKDAEPKQMALKEKELEIQAWIKEAGIMALDTTSMSAVQAEYFISLPSKILAKRRARSCGP